MQDHEKAWASLAPQLKFDAAGLIAAIAQSAQSGQVLMLAYMNEESLRQTLASGEVTYWSRSRQALWKKGESSGHRQRLKELRVDCDGDALLLLVEQVGPACHTNRPSCFYRSLKDGSLEVIAEPIIDAP